MFLAAHNTYNTKNVECFFLFEKRVVLLHEGLHEALWLAAPLEVARHGGGEQWLLLDDDLLLGLVHLHARHAVHPPLLVVLISVALRQQIVLFGMVIVIDVVVVVVFV